MTSFRQFSCANRRDGLYPDLQAACTLYYRCLNGVTYSYSCPEGEALGEGDETCLPKDQASSCPDDVPSTPPCVDQSDGYYPDFSRGCTHYYR